jgi:hypothetical protein
MRNTYTILVGICEGKDHLEDLGVDGKVILKLILKTQDVDPIYLVQDMDQ